MRLANLFVDHSDLAYFRGRKRGEALRGKEIAYPFIKKSEPGKKVRFLTDDGERSAHDIARLFHYTSLHQVDRFFMQIRRSIAGLERAPSYPRRASRKWYLYGFYSPEMVEKCLTIYRTYFNYIAKGKDRMTPAMRLGWRKVQCGSKRSSIFSNYGQDQSAICFQKSTARSLTIRHIARTDEK